MDRVSNICMQHLTIPDLLKNIGKEKEKKRYSDVKASQVVNVINPLKPLSGLSTLKVRAFKCERPLSSGIEERAYNKVLNLEDPDPRVEVPGLFYRIFSPCVHNLL